MRVFIDTEYTNLHEDNGPIKLISVGAVTADGEEFYVEISDNYQEVDCSQNVIDNVIPHLNRDKYGLTKAEAAMKFKEWCEGLKGEIEFVFDWPNFNIRLLVNLIVEHNLTIENANNKSITVDAKYIKQEKDEFFKANTLAVRHHALWNARALCYCCPSLFMLDFFEKLL
jgi:hypothetical protein